MLAVKSIEIESNIKYQKKHERLWN